MVFHHYAGGMGGKPYPCRVAEGKRFTGRTPAGSKAPGFYGTGGTTSQNGGQRLRRNLNKPAA